MQIPNLPDLIKDKLVESMNEWLDEHRDLIGEKWEKRLRREVKKFSKERATIPSVAGFAMWCYQSVCNLGVLGGFGVYGYAIHEVTWERGFDKKTTEKLFMWCCEALKLTRVHPELAKQLGWD